MTVSNLPLEIAEIASAHTCDARAAQDVVDLLLEQRPYVGVSLVVFDPLTGRHDTLAAAGYDERVVTHLSGRMVTDDAIYQYYKRQGIGHQPLKWADMPFAYRDTYSPQEVFMPAGFEDGITMRLHSRDRRYTGDLHISTDDPRFPTQRMLDDEVHRLQMILGNFVDSLRLVSNRFGTALDDATGCAQTVGGDIIELPGVEPIDPMLHDALRSRLAALHPEQVPEVFYFRGGSTWFRVHTATISGRARAVVVHEDRIPFGLTPRELEIVELLVSGATNEEIASRLFVTRATVAKHLENVLHKMGCPNRTAVVAGALAVNLRTLPHPRRPG